jgi:LVIVD repeat-containing protein/HYDIN/CFA65/VesB family protein
LDEGLEMKAEMLRAILPLCVCVLQAAACREKAPVLLQPGQFQSPLVLQQRLQGQVGHLHIDEVRYRASDAKLFQCSYTFGVIDARDPSNMRYLAENLKHNIPGDRRTPGCIHVAWDGDVIYTTHRGNLSNPTFITAWDISTREPRNPRQMKPTQLPVLQESGESYEGIDVEDSIVYVALKDHGLGAYRRNAKTGVLLRVGTVGGLGSTWGVRVDNHTAFVTALEGTLATVDVTDPTRPKLLGKVATGGVARGLAVDGRTAYVAAGSEGLVAVDVSDLASPKVIGKAETRGTAVRVDYSAGHAFVAAWNDARVYDVSRPSAPRFVGAVRLTTDVAYPDHGRAAVTARTLGIAANGRDMFVGNWFVPYSYRLYPDRTAPNLVLPEAINLTDFGPVAAGTSSTIPVEVKNQGTAPLTLISNWTTETSFRVAPQQLRIEPGGTRSLDLTYKAAGSETEKAILNIWSDDPLQPVRTGFVVGNEPGLGVGKQLPDTKVALLDGGDWSSSQVRGKVLLLAYFATF